MKITSHEGFSRSKNKLTVKVGEATATRTGDRVTLELAAEDAALLASVLYTHDRNPRARELLRLLAGSNTWEKTQLPEIVTGAEVNAATERLEASR